MASFSKKEAIKYGWQTVKKNIKFFIILMILTVAVSMTPSLISNYVAAENPALYILISLADIIIQLTITVGLIGITLKIYDKKKVNYRNLLDYFHFVLPYFLATIVYTLIVIGGLILLVIPGIIWAIKFGYYPYFIVDKKMGPIESLKASSKITRGHKWNLLLFGLLIGIINILGFLALFIGMIISAPVGMMAETYVFRKLSSK